MEFVKYLRIALRIIAPLMFACLMMHSPPVWASQKGATAVVARLNAALMQNMKKAKERGFRGRYKSLDPVLRDVFALSYMGEKTLGSYWEFLTPEQRNLYLDNYTDWTISTYAGRFDGYSGERFEIEDGEESKGDSVTVVSRLVIPHEDSVTFKYTLRRFQEKWRIVDIRILGVSQLSTTRAQFVSVMKHRGFDGLIASLKEKIAAFHDKEKE